MKTLSFSRGLSRVLFWSVISAAFIGPGTVTTCALAGLNFGTSLLWALSFSILATYVLQEAAARITLGSGKSLGEIMIMRHGKNGLWISRLMAGGIILGCAAYEAGNILGAVSGISLLWSGPTWLISLLIGLGGFILLQIRTISVLTKVLGLLVFVLGFSFLIVSLPQVQNPAQLLQHSLIPSFPPESALVIAGLIGTTIVPYNLFLGSGIGQGQTIREMRQGIFPAILIGGIISMAILFSGTLMEGAFSFQNAASVLTRKMGTWGGILYAVGLFGAGFTSVVTAPLAASLTAKTLLATTPAQTSWVWKGVLATGLVFGLLAFKPIPVILAAQIANALLLPFVSWQLFRCVNDTKLLSTELLNTRSQNLLLLLILLVTILLGVNSLLKAFQIL
ncbi:Nramp family divalent metal transporter [Arundinibacter roseus]|uniref:Divalent metal cation transporter n=1 Tax=Arundinibacter roseus TaxID=2070510 RepID=A0A4R4KG71_9BACT|nr:Nramp family divalent metal transporter [Arundinibacter roseus]TDB67040.1 divalent metal cation transporter [Arundinibacter roseus]